MEIQKIIQNLGLTEKEAAVYLASLELGDEKLFKIAKTAHIPRTSCYNMVKSLISKGLISVFKTGTGQFYKAESPERLLNSLRENEISLRKILPQLKSKHQETNNKPRVYFYENAQGIKTILEDILIKQHPLMAITSVDDALNVLGDNFRDFINKRHKKYLRVRLLTQKSDYSLELKNRDEQELRRTKFLPVDFIFKTANFIYGNRIAIIDFQRKNPFGLIIEDENISETQRMLFEITWKQATS
ncbi:MAG: hypothetical protein COV29_03260 [Candidatus Yanofskybacteria bacterium CG10_big_fil_rev_8_21_14_0_10_36_16]|uniref:Transcription regulator TrmB N-terminal domain-containing protein n=1 Tax=Candidatus Yanofskybacteria bacterium CG10_big_fil_rev_8_21_14_0_10_36_16 TaxID=1975096 RepID=A0A2J0Q6Z9_9BACT|nr:MAG: hypothetical protein COV29_03260 [Candidatus Yanofskybacteria bacterium CG10_big_fil_rev_8_21_14_0_10_36_16]